MSTPDLPDPGTQPGAPAGNPSATAQPDHGQQAGPGTVPPAGAGAPRPPGSDGFFDAVRRVGIYRSDDRWIGGVAAGVAERFRIDPLIVRGILFVTFFLGGAGLLLYGVAWALLPERRDGRIHLQEALRGNVDVALLGAIAFVVVGLSWSGGWWSWWDALHLGWLTGLFWVAAIVTIAVVTVSALTQRGPRGQRGPGTPGRPGPAHGPTGPTPPVPPAADAPWGSPGATSGPAPVQDHATWSAQASPYTSGGPTSTLPLPPHLADPSPGTPRPPVPPVAPVPPPASKPPRPPRPKGPGSAMTGVVVGLSLLLGALLLMVDRQGELPWPVFLTWAGASVVLAGLGIVVSGLRGRTSGGLGWLAVLALVVALPAATWRSEPELLTFEGTRTVDDGLHRVTDPEVAEEGFGVRWGDPTIDLSDLDLSDATGSSPVEVPVQLGAGDVRVIVPDGVPVRADVQVLAGSARWQVDGDFREVGGVSTQPVTFENDEVDAGADPLLVLEVVVGAGQVTIEEN